MFRKERERWMKLLEDEREAHRKERQELLNRLVQPRVIVDTPSEPRKAAIPHEPLELAFVGREVPPGVVIGENWSEKMNGYNGDDS